MMKTIPTLDDLRYDMICDKDPTASGFIIAVRTTKISCRPACPARTPLRKNVTFFVECAEAERAGYRACKRRRPDADDAADPTVAAIERGSERLPLPTRL